MGFLLLAWKYWRESLIAILFVSLTASFVAIGHYRNSVESVEQKCSATVQNIEKLQLEAVIAANAKANTVSESYEKLKSKRAEEAEKNRSDLQKIVTRTVYRNVCFDDDGLHNLSGRIASGNAKLAGEPVRAVSESAESK